MSISILRALYAISAASKYSRSIGEKGCWLIGIDFQYDTCRQFSFMTKNNYSRTGPCKLQIRVLVVGFQVKLMDHYGRLKSSLKYTFIVQFYSTITIFNTITVIRMWKHIVFLAAGCSVVLGSVWEEGW